MIKLRQLLDEVKRKGQYDAKDAADENLFETYLMLGELLNPNNAYEYNVFQGMYYFRDSSDNPFCARLVYQPTAEPFWEFKTWWVDNKQAVYDRLPDNTTAQDWDKRSDTIAKIFRDEIIPKFLAQNNSNIMKIKPLDSKRYQFSLRMVKKFTPKELKIIEDFPKNIIIEKI